MGVFLVSDSETNKLLKDLNDNIKSLSDTLGKIDLPDLIDVINKPKKMFYSSFVWGLSRGLGMALGFTILGALFLYVLKSLVALNIPLIGSFIADIVKIVQNNLR